MSDEENDTQEESSPRARGNGIWMKRESVVEKAREICEQYFEDGLKLTVRQLYYQFVARGLMGSGQNVYKMIVNTLSEARLEGRFPMHLIEDRGRDAACGDFTLCEDNTI